MREFGNYQAGGIPRRIIEQATREIANYTVSLILDQNLIGSGTLVSAMGVSGILTAHHVARLIFKSEGNALGINVADHLHQCFIDVSHLEHVEVGVPKRDPVGNLGPDLSFLPIRDARKLISVLPRIAL